MLKKILAHPKTTIAGIASVLGGLGLIGGGIKSALEGDFDNALKLGGAGILAITQGWGLIVAADAAKVVTPEG